MWFSTQPGPRFAKARAVRHRTCRRRRLDRVYEALRETETDWAAWHVYFGDERCLPETDTERNSRMANEAWLSHVSHSFRTDSPDSRRAGAPIAAAVYAATLGGVGDFDLVLLGLGEDGHTASLFPGHDRGNSF